MDEYHEYRNERGAAWCCLDELKKTKRCPVIGLSGTLMQNHHRELWSLVSLAQPELLGAWKYFHERIVRPLNLARYVRARGDRPPTLAADDRSPPYNELTFSICLRTGPRTPTRTPSNWRESESQSSTKPWKMCICRERRRTCCGTSSRKRPKRSCSAN